MPPISVIRDAARSARPGQIAGRARRLIPPVLLAAGRPEPVHWEPLAAGLGFEVAPQGGPVAPPERGHAFRYVGLELPAAHPELFSAAPHGVLFAFGVHSFGELAHYAAEGQRTPDHDAFWVGVLERWLRDCGRPDRLAWHPYALSGRIVAWTAALSAGGWPETLSDAMRASLSRQLRVLRRSVEHDVGGNHVLRNGAALVVGGACLGQDRAWRAGERLLAREVPRQLLPSGGHEERSPSYHREALGDLRAAARVLADLGRPAAWADRLVAMETWLGALAAPDGTLPLLNDAWEGPPVTPGDGRDDLDGLLVLRGDDLHAVLDCGPLGPAHLPAHAHADALSFSLWADGGWAVADPGALTYAGPERDAFRGTAAHATLTVGESDQCTFWGPFRASHLPRVWHGPIEERADGWRVVEARHDGYRPAVHVRRFGFHATDGMVVLDRLEAGGAHAVESRLPLGPGRGSGRLEVRPLDGDCRREPARFAPYLGTAVDTEVLVQRRTLRPGETCGWSLLRPGAVVPSL